MPMFDFYCPTCQKTFEELVFDDANAPCPHCGNTGTERRLSIPSPLKTGAFPYKVGPVHPLARKMAQANAPACGSCASGQCGMGGMDAGGQCGMGTGGCGAGGCGM